MRRHLVSTGCLFGLVLAALAVVGPSTPAGALPAPGVAPISAGWYDQTGFHAAGSDNYAVGNVTPLPSGRLRNFFVFDLSAVSGDVVSVSLTAASYNGSGAPSTLTLYDVATPVATLTAEAAGATAVYADLGSGTVYGSVAVADPSAPSITVPLNRSGIAAVQAATGGVLAVGGDYAPDAVTGALIFGSTGSDSGHAKSDVQLVVTTRPAPWPQFRVAPAHPGSVPATSVITPANVTTLAQTWQGTAGGPSSPAVAGGVVYVGSADDKLYAYDAAGPGTPLWTLATGGAVVSSPAVADGRVFVGSNDGKLYAVDAAGGSGCAGAPKTCAPLWTGVTGTAVQSSPAVVGGVVYVGSNDGKLYAFDAAGVTGCAGSPKVCTPLWTAATGGPVLSSPAVSGGTVYVGSDDHRFYAFDALGVSGCSGTPRTCVPLWSATTGAEVESSPTVAAGLVYVGSNDGHLYAFDAAGVAGCAGTPTVCSPRWSATTGIVFSSPAVAGGRVFVGSFDKKLYAFDAAAGSLLWTSTPAATDLPIASPAVANGLVFIGSVSGDHQLAAFDAAGVTNCSGAPKVCGPVWAGDTGGSVRSSAAVAGGMVYVGSDNGALHAFALPGPTAPGEYHPLTPARILDTRDGTGGIATAVGPGATVTLQVSGRGGVPATGVSAVSVNVAVTQPTSDGYLTVFPSGAARPLASSINFAPGRTVANMVVAKLGADGSVSIFNPAGSTHVVVDVEGWFGLAGAPPGDRYNALVPARILDTRDGTGGVGTAVGPGATVTLQVTGRGGVPAAGVSAVAVNLAVTSPTADGYLTVFPSDAARPLASSINFAPGKTVANMVVAKLGSDGTISIFNPAGTTHVVVDVEGWFGSAGAHYNPLSPARILDTRDGTGGVGTAVGPGATVTLQVAGRGGVPAAGVTAVAVNVAVTQPSADGYLTVFPGDTPRPLASSINFEPGQTVSNLVVAKLKGDGTIAIFNPTGNTHVVVDVEGWFA